jgi:hypothetical protein
MDFKVKTTVNVTHLIADMGVRYWEDAEVNGVPENDDDPQIPLKDGDSWKIKIDLQTGEIEGWPSGITASTHYKVCDAGVYSLLSESGDVVALRDGYVPDMLCPKDEGYGDYVIMDINESGVIQGWSADLSYFEGDEDD